MPFSFYNTTILTSQHALESLSHILTVAEKHPNADTLPAARLSPDMRPLSSQIHLAAQTIERFLCRLSKTAHVAQEDTIATFGDMHARIAATQTLLAATEEAAVNSAADEVAPTDLTQGMKADMSAAGYAEGMVANLFFHLSIAYAILRSQGVALGKPDYIMPFVRGHLGAVELDDAVKKRQEAMNAREAAKEEK